MKKRLMKYINKKLNKSLNQDKVGNFTYYKLSNNTWLLKADIDMTFPNKYLLLSFIEDSMKRQKAEEKKNMVKTI